MAIIDQNNKLILILYSFKYQAVYYFSNKAASIALSRQKTAFVAGYVGLYLSIDGNIHITRYLRAFLNFCKIELK